MSVADERDELDTMCELLVQDVRVARAVAHGILAANQLQVAATLDLLIHLDMVGPTDALTRVLVANVRRALGSPSAPPRQTVANTRLPYADTEWAIQGV